jgi:hypothetical protein
MAKNLFTMRASTLVLASALMAPRPAAAGGPSITYGPILSRGVTPDQMIVKWGTGGSSDATSVSFRVKGTGTFTDVTGAAGPDHEVVLSGLSLGTAYEYYVTSAGAAAANPFSTCPQPGLPMDVVFYGDTRAPLFGSTNHPAVFAQIAASQPEMVFQSGDIVYSGDYASYLSDFFPVIGSLAKSTPYMAAPGNHDNGSTLSSNFGKVFASPRAAGAAWQPYYAFTCGNSMFISLNSNSISDSTQLSFLNGRLAAAKADATLDHVFVFFHHPPYSTGTHGDSSAVQSTWVPLFSDPASKVTVVFSGHDHAYERMSNGSGVAYIVSGGGGADLYSSSSSTKGTQLKYSKTYNFVKLHINGSQVTGTAIDINSSTPIDTFTLGTAPPPPADGGTTIDSGTLSDAGTTTDAGSSTADGSTSTEPDAAASSGADGGSSDSKGDAAGGNPPGTINGGTVTPTGGPSGTGGDPAPTAQGCSLGAGLGGGGASPIGFGLLFGLFALAGLVRRAR